jgi:SulP family sulfate permease
MTSASRPPVPKLVVALRRYAWSSFTADVGAGLTVALVAGPLALAFAIASGLPPEYGLYGAGVAGAIVAAGGGSMCQIAGPAGAFVVLAANVVAGHGVGGLVTCTLMAGAMLIALGLSGLGEVVRFIPRPVVVGFANGVAIVLASTQLRELLGLTMPAMPGAFAPRVAAIAAALPTLHVPSAALAAATLAIVVVCTLWRTRVPGAIVALAAGTLAVAALGLPVATIDTRFHGLQGWPSIAAPELGPGAIVALLPPAFAVAMLGAIASVMSATAADRRCGDRHNPNVELIAQGLANLASPLFGGLPSAGAAVRTAVNVDAGARTPIAAVVQALILLAIALWGSAYAALVPMPVLAAIVIAMAWRAGDWREVTGVFHGGPLDAGVWAITLGLTILADLTQAVEVGLALAALLVIRRVATTADLAEVAGEAVARTPAGQAPEPEIPPFVAVFRVTGPLLFGSVDALDLIRDRLDGLPPIVILRLRHMTAVDAAGLQAIEDLARAVQATSRVFLVAGAREQPLALMRRARFERRLGADRLCATFEDALGRAREIHAHRFSGAWPDVGAPIPLPPDSRPESGDEAFVNIR